MIKDSYKIPADLNTKYFDAEIAVQNKDGVGLKPTPMKVILFYILGIFIGVMMIAITPLKEAHIWQIVLFFIAWFILIFMLGKTDKDKRMNLRKLPVIFNYMKRSNREVYLHTYKEADAMMRITGICDISSDKQTEGLIRFVDGSYGRMYNVVGTASILLFDNDKNAIINRVDAFYRKIPVEGEIITITIKEPQAVYRQLYNLNKRIKNLSFSDKDIDNCAKEQFYILRDYIGKNFKSIHQYMILKGDNFEHFRELESVFMNEYNTSQLVFKRITVCDYEDTINVLRGMYTKYGDTKLSDVEFKKLKKGVS